VTTAGHWFRCRGCGATIGRFDGPVLRVEIAAVRVAFPLVPGTRFTCRKCGVPTVLDGVVDSSPKSQDGRGARAERR